MVLKRSAPASRRASAAVSSGSTATAATWGWRERKPLVRASATAARTTTTTARARRTRFMGHLGRKGSDDGSPQEEAHGQNRLADRERAGQTRHALSWHDQREPKEQREQDRRKPAERDEEVGRHRREDVHGDPHGVRDADASGDRHDRPGCQEKRRDVAGIDHHFAYLQPEVLGGSKRVGRGTAAQQ